MKFKNILLLFPPCGLMLLQSCTSPLIYRSTWQEKPVNIDGKAAEWKIPLDYFDDKSKLNFSVSNDNKNIYICVRATEEETQKGIIRNGLQIWFDTTGGKKNQVGIQFPIVQIRQKEAGSGGAQSSEASGIHSLKGQYSGTPRQIKLTGFTGVPSGFAETPNMYGINACLNWDSNNIMIYEVCIPFGTFFKAKLSPLDSSKVFGLSFVVIVTPKNTGGGGRSSGGGGSGGMGGGGMHGGGGGRHGGGGGGSSGPESFTAHIKFRPSVGQN